MTCIMLQKYTAIPFPNNVKRKLIAGLCFHYIEVYWRLSNASHEFPLSSFLISLTDKCVSAKRKERGREREDDGHVRSNMSTHAKIISPLSCTSALFLNYPE